MKKLFSAILSLLLLLSLVFSLFSCGETSAPGGTDTPSDNAAQPVNVLILRSNAGEGLSDSLASSLTAAGNTVTVKTFSDLKTAFSTDGYDLIVNDCSNLLFAPAKDALSAYLEAGGAMMTLGNAPFTELSYLVNGRYLSAADILAAPEGTRVIADFEDDTALSALTETSDTPSTSFHNTLTVEDRESGYGKSLSYTMGMFRTENYQTMNVNLSGTNALALRVSQSVTPFAFSLILTCSDGSRFGCNCPSLIRSDEWDNYIVAESDFTPLSGGEKDAALDFDTVTTLSFGLSKNVTDKGSGTDYRFGFDRFVAFTMEENPNNSINETEDVEKEGPDEDENAPAAADITALFASDYFYTYGNRTLTDTAAGEESAFVTDGIHASGTAFTLDILHGGDNGVITRLSSLLTGKTADGDTSAAWLAVYQNKYAVAAFGLTDPTFYTGAGATLVTDTALLLAKGAFLRTAPRAADLYTDEKATRIPVTLTGGDTLSYTVIDEAGTTLAEDSLAVSTLAEENGARRAEIPVSADGNAARTVSLSLKNGDTLTDTLSFTVTFHDAPKTVHVSCVGDSITEGMAASDEEVFSYPAQLVAITGPVKIEAQNFGVSGTSAMHSFGNSYFETGAHADSLAVTDCDYVVLMFGTNDASVWEGGKDHFRTDYAELLSSYLALDSHPTVIVCCPIPRLSDLNKIAVIRKEVTPTVQEIAAANNCPVIDMYDFFEGKTYLMAETIHPNDRGYRVLAQAVYDKITELEAAK